MSSIILTGGGTAGHCIPNLALLPSLKKHFDNIYYIGSVGGIEEVLAKEAGLRYFGVTTCKFVRSKIFKNLSIPSKLIRGVKESKKIISDINPTVIFSKGGYAALPTSIAAKKLGIPLIIHESDLSVGLANKLASKYALKVLTSFQPTAESLKKGVWTGFPVREELMRAERLDSLKKFGFDGAKPVILFIGGSSGSKALNNALEKSINDILPLFDVLHIIGRKNSPIAQSRGYKAITFTNDMASVYAAADIAVSRCGSNAAAELLLLKKPTLFIPLPKGSSRGDQIENAEYFYKRGLCELLYESNLTAKSLTAAVLNVYAGRYNIKRNIEAENCIKIGNEEIIRVLSSYS